MANEEEKEKLDIEKLYSEVIKENLAIQRVNTDELKTQIDLSNEIGGAFKITNEQGKSILKNSRDLAKQTAIILRDEESIIKGRRSKIQLEKEITKAKNLQLATGVELRQVTKELDSLSNLLAESAEAVTDENLEQLLVLENIQFGLRSNLDISRENLELLTLEDTIRERIENKLGKLGSLVKGISKIPIVGELLDSKQVLLEMETTAAKVGSTKFDVMKAGLSEIGKQIKEGLTDPLVMITALFKAGFAVDQRTVELERSLGVSRSEAESLDERFQSIASNSGDLAINTKEVTIAFNALNAQIGGAATTFSDELLESAAELIKLNRLSEESASRFALSAQRAGVSLESVKNESIAVVNASTQERGLRLDINKVLDEAGKITGVIAAQLGGNIVAISKAISVAKQFGMELEQVAAAGRKLLDFESSISNELEAELLLGKQINLERARLAALTGDYETLTREINKNVGDFGDFTQMNVLQQEALAASVGMTADQLSDVLLKNQDIEKLAQEARAMGNQDLADQLEKRSVQEKFNDTVVKLKALFTDILSGPIMGILSAIGKVLGRFGEFLGFLGLGKGGIADMVVQFAFFSKLIFGTINPIIALTKLFKGLGIAQAFLVKQGAAYKSGTLATNVAERIGLINKRQAVLIRTREVALQTIGNKKSAARNLYENATLGATVKRNIANKIELARSKAITATAGLRNAMETSIVGKLILQGIAQARNLVIGIKNLAIAKAKAIAEFAGVSALTVGIGTAVALAALVGAVAYISSVTADDMISPGKNQSGYGSRMLLAPEGAFALNNKDTVIAGTNLFKANDVLMGDEGSIKVDKLSPNNQQPTSNNDAAISELVNEIKGLRGDTQSVAQNVAMADRNAQNKPVVNTSSIFNHQKDANKQVSATLLT